jgi:transcriptional regulator with XRE-family HTH domain
MKRPPFERTTLSAGVGEAVRTFRKVAEISQQQLAERVGFDLVVIEAIEEGEFRLTLGDIEKLAETFNVEVYRLVALADTHQRVVEFPPGDGTK